LFGYLLIHYAFAVFNGWDSGGLGNISRAYLNALWPFIFCAAFYAFGSSQVIGAALRALYLALLIRATFGFINFFLDESYIIPVINYTIDPQDLRASGAMLAVLSCLMMISTRGSIARVGHALVFLFALGACLVGGSRAQMAALLLFPLILCVIFRKWTQLVVAVGMAGLLVIAINLKPAALEALPYRVQRALSGLIISPVAE